MQVSSKAKHLFTSLHGVKKAFSCNLLSLEHRASEVGFDFQYFSAW